MALRRILTRLAARLFGRHCRACCCPLCNQDEREMRAMLRMPARHPELLTRELDSAQEEELGAWASELWPADEWAEIIIEIRRAEGQS